MARRAQVSPPPEQIRCPDCRRYRLKGRSCDHCDLQLPAACTCDVFPSDRPRENATVIVDGKERSGYYPCIPDAHHHLLHALLEMIYKQAVEETDEWILQRGTDVPPTPRPHWSHNPELASHLAEHPVMAALCHRQNGVEAVYEWAGVRPREAMAHDLHLVGWSDDIVAYRLAEYDARVAGRLPLEPLIVPPLTTVQRLYTNADERIRATLALVEGAIAS